MTAAAPHARIAGIDRLRGLAVLAMFLVHSSGPWLAAQHRGGAYSLALGKVSGMVAPVFLFLAGVAMTLAAAAPAGQEPSRGRGRLIVRGLLLICAGYGLNLLFWALRDFTRPHLVARVDILHCVGASMALMAAFARPRGKWNPAAAIAFAILLQGAQLTWRLPLGDWLPAPLAAYLTRHAGSSLFPLFPYGAWVALGLFVGPAWLAWRSANQERRFLAILGIASAVCLALWPALALLEQASGLADIRGPDGVLVLTEVSFFMAKVALVLALFALTRLAEHPLSAFGRDPLLLWGRTSLLAYTAHLVLVYHVFHRTLGGRLTPVMHALSAVLFAALMWLACLAWDRLARGLGGRSPPG